MIFAFYYKQLLARIKIYLATGECSRALDLIQWNRIFIPGNDTQIIGYEGIFLYNTGNYQKAYQLLKKMVFQNSQTDRDLTAAYFFLKTCLKLQKYSEASALLSAAFQKNKHHFLVLLMYHECQKHSIRTDSFTYDHIYTGDILLHRILYHSLVSLLQKEYKNALTILEHYKERFSRVYFFNILYLSALFNTSEYERILLYFEENNAYLSSIDFLYILSASLYKLAYYNFSRDLLHKIHGYEKPKNHLVLVNLGKIYLNTHKHIKSIQHLKKIEKKLPAGCIPDGYIPFLIGINFQKLGMLNEALSHYQLVSDKSIYYNKSLFNSFLIYYDNNKFDEAREILEKHESYFTEFLQFSQWKENLKTGRTDKLKGTIQQAFSIPLLITGAAALMFIIYFAYRYIIQ